MPPQRTTGEKLRSRRAFLAGVGAGAAGLAGCLGVPGRGTDANADGPDVTAYVGAYHWGFAVLDEQGTERESMTVDPGTEIRLVAFNTSAHDAVAQLPQAVRSALPDHETLEERNGERIPDPPSGDMHEALHEANERTPDHSVAVMPSGGNHMRGPMNGGMMLHPIPLPHDAPRPATAGIVASERGDYTLSCVTDCGYGHPFMDRDGAFVVR
ncbi:MAG: hypothetical protein ABEJ06_01010 [Haloarculaceae archaeon]